MTPFEVVLVFFMGGLTLTSMVGDDASFTNAIVQIITVAALHYLIALAKHHSPKFGLLVDGTPIVLLAKGEWRVKSMQGMRIADDDVMAAARDKGLSDLSGIDYAILERNGEISILPVEQEA